MVYYPGRCLRRNRESSRKRYLTLDAARIISANLIRESAEEFFTCLLLLLLRCLGVTRGPTITRNRMRIIVNRSPSLRHAVSRITKIKYFAPSPSSSRKRESESSISYNQFFTAIDQLPIEGFDSGKFGSECYVCEEKKKEEREMRRSTTTGLRLEGKTMELEFDRD